MLFKLARVIVIVISSSSNSKQGGYVIIIYYSLSLTFSPSLLSLSRIPFHSLSVSFFFINLFIFFSPLYSFILCNVFVYGFTRIKPTRYKWCHPVEMNFNYNHITKTNSFKLKRKTKKKENGLYVFKLKRKLYVGEREW